MSVKVCHVTSAHNSNDVRIFHKECASLAKEGYETYLVARGESREEKGVHVVGVGDAPAGRVKRMTEFSKKVYLKALEINADIYHLHDPELLPYGIKLKKHGKKVIFDSHENYVEQIQHKTYIPKVIRKIIAFTFSKYEDHIFSKIDALIFPCTYRGKHPFEGKCKITETVDNFPMLEELYDKYDETVEKIANSICYIGSLTHNRGITALVSAMEKIDGKLFLAGNFSPAEYKRQLEEMPGWSKVEYLGQLSREKVLELLQSMQIGAATILNVGQYNRYDNLATKAYEYMSLGIPVLLTKAPYNVSLNKKYSFAYCVDPETDEIVNAIKSLLENPEEAKEMGKNGRRAVEQEFNWETQEEKLLALYKNFL